VLSINQLAGVDAIVSKTENYAIIFAAMMLVQTLARTKKTQGHILDLSFVRLNS
jgi:hypothetical protein